VISIMDRECGSAAVDTGCLATTSPGLINGAWSIRCGVSGCTSVGAMSDIIGQACELIE